MDFAENGQPAVERLASRPYDLVLMVIQMPVLGGVEATQRIRKLAGCEKLPILAMTANAFADDRARRIEVGMNDFIVKPVLPELFYVRLLRWLSAN